MMTRDHTRTTSLRAPMLPPPLPAPTDTIELRPTDLPWQQRVFLVIAAVLGLRLVIRGRRWT